AATRSYYFFFSSRRRHTRFSRDWSSDVCSSDLQLRGWAATKADSAAVFGKGPEGWTSLTWAKYWTQAQAVGRALVRWGHEAGARSEERRVGKECRSGWSREQREE